MMAFSAKQIRALNRNVAAPFVRTRAINGKELSYIEGWFALAEANRIFGFDGWDRETVESRCVSAREARGAWSTIYVVKVRVTVRADARAIIREAHGTGEGHGPSAAETHEFALKAAETDATKRALATFGKPFGLALYSGKPAAPMLHGTPAQATRSPARPIGTPATDEVLAQRRQPPQRQVGADVPLATPPTKALLPRQEDSDEAVRQERAAFGGAAPRQYVGASVDKSVLSISEPVRRRDKAHLRFVATQPCLICGRTPSDPHHLRFLQPRAIGRKVSDEFTVPLCRIHHRELHHGGDEPRWWREHAIDPTVAAHALWSGAILHSDFGTIASEDTPPHPEEMARSLATASGR